MEYSSIARMFYSTAERYPRRPAFSFKEGGGYRDLTYAEAETRVRRLASALAGKLGIAPGERVSIISFNRYQWALADLAILSVQGVTVPVYPNLPANQVAVIVRDAGSRAIFVEDDEQLAKLLEIRDQLPSLEYIIHLQTPAVELPAGVFTLEELLREGEKLQQEDPSFPETRVAAIKPDDLLTIIYTSGTTGTPKGAMLSNRNILTNLRDIDKIIKLTEEDVFLSFLPLSHVYERTAGYYLPLSHGCKIAYAENMLSVGDNLPEVHPTVMVAVPRFFEKMRARVVEQVEKGPALKRKIFNWALGVGSEWFAATRSGNVSGWLKFRRNLADKLVFSKIKEKLGGRLRFFVSGAAPLQQSLGEFFFSAGVLILEGYGLTETSPVIAVNHPDRFKFGTVGLKLDSVELKIADDGEILVKGDSIMLGYYNKPEETAEVMEDGWFHTGDIGFIDEEGFLKITDRKKNIIVTSGGKNVAPQPIEGLLTTSPYIEQALLVGDQRNFISALIVPNFEKLEEAAQVRDLKYRDTEELVALPALNKLIGDEIERLCQGLGRFERPRKFVLLGREFSIEAGEMTPSLKIKRNAVLKLYDDIIEKIYSDE